MHFVKRNIRLGSRIAGVYREDIYELPIDSIREMISNAVCHRSYISPGSIQVAIYDDRLEVTSPGRISPDLTMEQLIAGNSRVRNVAIGAAFQYMHIIEKWGTGIPRIYQEAREYGLPEPDLKDFGTSFRISIYRKEAKTDAFGVVRHATNHETIETNHETNKETHADGIFDTLTSNEKKILHILIKNSSVTQKTLAEKTGLSISTVKRIIPALQEKAVIKRKGNNRNGKWTVLIQIPD